MADPFGDIWEQMMGQAGRAHTKGQSTEAALREEGGIYRSRLQAWKPLIEAVEKFDPLFQRWAGQGFPPRGDLCAQVNKAHTEVHRALMALPNIPLQ